MPNYNRYASNPYTEGVQPIEWDVEYAPTAQAYHGFALANGSDEVIGRVQNFNPAQNYNRNHQLIYELNNRTFGIPVDVMPGIATGFVISMVRVELWGAEIETVLENGGNVYNVLNDQVRPVKLYEYLFRGPTPYMQWVYKGCWWTAKNQDAYTSEGDGIIRVNCDLVYVRRELLASTRRAA